MTGPKKSDARNHHYIPQGYLRRFADNRDQVAVIDGMRSRRFTTSVRNAAAERDLYSVINEAGERSVEAETRLGTYEAAAYLAMDRLEQLQHPVSEADIVPVAQFIALLLTRTPEFRDDVEAEAEEMFPGEADPYRSQRFLISAMFHFLDRLTPQLLKLRWHVVQRDEPNFVTGDHPLVHWAEASLGTPRRRLGILSAEETYFPLSPRAFLLLLPPSDDQLPTRLVAPPGAAITVNGRFTQDAYQYVFYHPNHPAMQGLNAEGERPIIGTDGVPVDENGMPMYRKLRKAIMGQQTRSSTQ
jgi:Protein of unknown function (DUF4238)